MAMTKYIGGDTDLTRPYPLPSRPALEQTPRRKLLHILPTVRLSSMSVFALELLPQLPDYEHTVVYTDPTVNLSDPYLGTMQLTGADFLQIDDVQVISNWRDIATYAAAIYYDVPPIKLAIPTLYYAYSRYARSAPYDILIMPCEYAAEQLGSRPDYIIPPAIQSRPMRGLYIDRETKDGKVKPFTVGIFSSNDHERMPRGTVEYLAQTLPPDIRILYTHTNARSLVHKRKHAFAIPCVLNAHMRGMQMADVLIYAHDGYYIPLFGRMCLEMMASGVPVLCQRRGGPAAMYTDDVDIVFHDSQEQLPAQIKELRTHKSRAALIGANAQLRAGWNDLTIHVGTLKGVLRKLGA